MLLYFYLLQVVNCHLIFNRPEVWGSDNSIQLEQPLEAGNSNWQCAGNMPENNGIITFTAGSTYDIEIICGEKDYTAPGCWDTDWHSGPMYNQYSGCVLGVNYNNNYRNTDDYFYLSHSRECAKYQEPTAFQIPQNVENCNNCICSWAWAPSLDYSSPQFYHNCFYCNIVGGTGNRLNMRKHDFINVDNSNFQNVVYNDLITSLNYTTRRPITPTQQTTRTTTNRRPITPTQQTTRTTTNRRPITPTQQTTRTTNRRSITPTRINRRPILITTDC